MMLKQHTGPTTAKKASWAAAWVVTTATYREFHHSKTGRKEASKGAQTTQA
jgi:hypothetical protein